jgi:NAD(P)-dependent dehydrogenase (short-subunit alcohol dehydrogenase family)
MKDKRQPEVVVVTGASAGLGRAIVREFAQRGASIGLLARGRDRLEDAAAEVRELGGRALVLVVDVADAEAMDRAAEAVEAQFGPIDIWINNAMATVFSPVWDVKAEEYQRVTEVTYLGYVHGTLSALKRMRGRDRGRIIQVGSALAYRGIPLQSAYCAAKHAIKGFTESLRSELLHEKSAIRVSMVEIPALNTPQFSWGHSHMAQKPQPVPPIFQPEVGARAVYHAAHHHRRDWWVTWPTVKAIVGERFLPGAVMDLLATRRGWESQLRDEPDDPNRASNLWEPVPGRHDAHGAFEGRAKGWSAEVWLDTHRKEVLAAAAGVGLAAVAVASAMRRR